MCRATDNKCGCTSDSHCPLSQVCYSDDNKCYTGGLSLGESCAADNGIELDTRCSSGLCRGSDDVCGCTSDSHCPSSQSCYSADNMCYLGTSPDATTTINIDNFIIPAGAIVNVLGTLIVEAAGQIVIDGTLNGNGGGYVGAEASNTNSGVRAQSGESPPDTTGQGGGGKSWRGYIAGGGGGGHGMCLLCCLSLFSNCCFVHF